MTCVVGVCIGKFASVFTMEFVSTIWTVLFPPPGGGKPDIIQP